MALPERPLDAGILSQLWVSRALKVQIVARATEAELSQSDWIRLALAYVVVNGLKFDDLADRKAVALASVHPARVPTPGSVRAVRKNMLSPSSHKRHKRLQDAPGGNGASCEPPEPAACVGGAAEGLAGASTDEDSFSA